MCAYAIKKLNGWSFVKTFVQVAIKIQRFWRKRKSHLAYMACLAAKYAEQRQRIRCHAKVHYQIMKQQEDNYRRLANRVRMFGCDISRLKLTEYKAARRLQCATRCRQARAWVRRWVGAASIIQKSYRRWLGCRFGVWKRRLRQLHHDRDSGLLFRKQKVVATCVAQHELDILEIYAKIERDMIQCRHDIDVQEQRAECKFKEQARKVRASVLGSDLRAWVPQTGAVSGKVHYLNTVTAQIRQEHPHQNAARHLIQEVREKIDDEKRPFRSKILSDLENLKSQHENTYTKVHELMMRIRELSPPAELQ